MKTAVAVSMVPILSALIFCTMPAVAGTAPISIYPDKSDASISQNIKRSLDGDPLLRPYDLEVTSHDGVVRLWGVVSWPSEQQQAEQHAQQVAGVNGVHDNIKIYGLNDAIGYP